MNQINLLLSSCLVMSEKYSYCFLQFVGHNHGILIYFLSRQLTITLIEIELFCMMKHFKIWLNKHLNVYMSPWSQQLLSFLHIQMYHETQFTNILCFLKHLVFYSWFFTFKCLKWNIIATICFMGLRKVYMVFATNKTIACKREHTVFFGCCHLFISFSIICHKIFCTLSFVICLK